MPDSSVSADGGLADLLGVEQAVDLLLEQDRPGLLDGHAAGLGRLGHDLLEHVLEVHLHLFEVAGAEDRDRCHRSAGEGDLDLAVVELAGGEPGPQLLARPLAAVGGLAGGGRLALRPRGRRGGRRQEQVEQPLLDPRLRLLLDPLPLRVAHQHDRRLDQVADQALDVAADVADLGVLGRLGLHERRADQDRQPAGDLGLAHAGRADQHDVLGRHLPAQVLGELPAPPPIPQRDRHRALGVVLAHDVAVQLGDDLAGRQLALAPVLLLVVWHGSSSTVRLAFV